MLFHKHNWVEKHKIVAKPQTSVDIPVYTTQGDADYVLQMRREKNALIKQLAFGSVTYIYTCSKCGDIRKVVCYGQEKKEEK